MAGRKYRISATNKMKYYAYLLQSSKNQKFYYGHTQNINVRLKEHNSGKTKSTRANIPYEIVFYEVCESRKAAREK
jgi:putative endonuclease